MSVLRKNPRRYEFHEAIEMPNGDLVVTFHQKRSWLWRIWRRQPDAVRFRRFGKFDVHETPAFMITHWFTYPEGEPVLWSTEWWHTLANASRRIVWDDADMSSLTEPRLKVVR